MWEDGNDLHMARDFETTVSCTYGFSCNNTALGGNLFMFTAFFAASCIPLPSPQTTARQECIASSAADVDDAVSSLGAIPHKGSEDPNANTSSPNDSPHLTS